MTTYTAISATETQSGKPLTESLLTRLANNHLAQCEGDATAPPILLAALKNAPVSSFALAEQVASSSHNSESGQVDVLSISFDHMQSGNASVLLIAQIECTDSSGALYLRVYADGTLLKQFDALSASFVAMEVLASGARTIKLTAGAYTGGYPARNFTVEKANLAVMGQAA